MRHYFAYGSNMLRARLEARVGPVVIVGAALLDGYAHSFTKRGDDGTGKGNIATMPGSMVHGVLYRLDLGQIDRLTGFEGGYRMVSLSVRHGARVIEATSYQALAPVSPLRPADDYLRYYERGMREHGLPEDYVTLVLGQAAIRT